MPFALKAIARGSVSRKLKILILTENFPPERNAAATRISERALYWIRDGHEVTVITSHPNFPDGKVFEGYTNSWRRVDEFKGIRVVRVMTYIAPNKGFLFRILDFLSFMVTSFLAGLREPRPDVLIANSPQFFCAVSGWAVAKLRGLPFIFELADLWPASISAVGVMKKGFLLRMVESLELFLYRQSARVVALTDSFKRDLVQRGIAADKIDVVINGVELSTYSRRAKSQSLPESTELKDKFVIGYVGTLGMAHALENVLSAARLLKAADQNRIHFLIVGTGAALDTLKTIKLHDGLDNVTLTGAKPKEAMPDYWSLCDVALIHLKNSTLFEGVIPSKMFEAMGMGLPLLFASPLGEGPKIVAENHCGWRLPAEDPNALAQEVLRLSNSPDEVARASVAAETAAPRYTRKRQAEDFMRSIQACLTESTPASTIQQNANTGA